MCDYPFFIPQVVLFANSSLFWFKVTNEHREFRNYLFISIAYFHLLNNKKGTSLRKSQCLICLYPDLYIQNIRSAVLSGMWALPTLQVTVMETIPFTFPRRVFMNRQALRGMRTLPSRMVAS